MKKKVFAFLLSVCMFLSVLPLNAAAAETVPAPNSITAHWNTGSGNEPAPHTIPVEQDSTYPKNARVSMTLLLTQPGYAFTGFNTKPDGSGAWFVPNTQYRFYYSAMWDDDAGEVGPFKWHNTVSLGNNTYDFLDLPTDVYAQWEAIGTTRYAVYYNTTEARTGNAVTPVVEEIPEPAPGAETISLTLKDEKQLGFSETDSLGTPQFISYWSYEDANSGNGRFVWLGEPLEIPAADTPPVYLTPGWSSKELVFHSNYPVESGFSEDAFTTQFGNSTQPLPLAEQEAKIFYGKLTGYYAMGWNTAADGSGTWYDQPAIPVSSVTADDLYTQWKKLPSTDYVAFYNGRDTQFVAPQNGKVVAPEIQNSAFMGWGDSKYILSYFLGTGWRIGYDEANRLDQLITADGSQDITDTLASYAGGTEITLRGKTKEFRALYAHTTQLTGSDPAYIARFHANGAKFPLGAEEYWTSPSLGDQSQLFLSPGENWEIHLGYSNSPKLFQSVPAGKRLASWNTEPDGSGATYAAGGFEGILLTKDTDFYAQWENKPVPPTPSQPDGPAPEEPEEPTPPAKTPFTDVEKHWGRDAIAWVYEQGLFQGVSATEFKPNLSMERGMLAAVLYRLAKEPAVNGSIDFDDVSGEAYYADAVKWAAETGVVYGDGQGNYLPGNKITREQLATMLYRFAGLTAKPEATGDLSAFTDAGKISGYARDALSWAVGKGILFGKGGGQLDPQGSATRAEVAAILQRFAS